MSLISHTNLVDPMPWEIRIYINKRGKAPFSDWLNSLKDARTRAIIRIRVNRIRLGNFGDCRPVGQGVSELRIDYGPRFRVYLGKVGTKVVLLLSGGVKGSQGKDIKKAMEFWADYRSGDHAKE